MWYCVIFMKSYLFVFIIIFSLKIAAVANSTEYRLGLIKNANMKGKLLQISSD